MSSDNDPARVAADARWLPLGFEQGGLRFVHLQREQHAQVPFLTAQYLGEVKPAPSTRLAPVAQLSPPKDQASIHFIFHSAFCCSTLLARALDIPGAAMGLKEPQILNELALAHHRRHLDRDLLDLAVRLLARPWGPGEAVVVKPSNEANLLAEPILDAHPASRAILLYAPLPRFLVSASRKGMWGRIWARRLFRMLRSASGLQLGFSNDEQFEQTDLQIAALAWLLHHAQLIEIAQRFPDRARFLDSETFLADKSRSLAAVGEHFGLDVDTDRWRQISEGPAFAEHSKRIGKSFDTEGDSSSSVSMPLVDEEIEMVAGWARQVAGHVGLSLDPPKQWMLLR